MLYPLWAFSIAVREVSVLVQSPMIPGFPECCQLPDCARASGRALKAGAGYPWNSDLICAHDSRGMFTIQGVTGESVSEAGGSLRLSHARLNLGRHLEWNHDAGFAALPLSARGKLCIQLIFVLFCFL